MNRRRPTVAGRLLAMLLACLILAVLVFVWNATVGMDKPFTFFLFGVAGSGIATGYWIVRDRRKS